MVTKSFSLFVWEGLEDPCYRAIDIGSSRYVTDAQQFVSAALPHCMFANIWRKSPQCKAQKFRFAWLPEVQVFLQ